MAILGSLGDLVLALSADTARFQSDLGRADRMAKKFSREVGRALGNLAGVIVALAGSAGIGSLVKGQIDAADAAGKLGQKIGISTEALSSYMVAARLADVSNEQLQTGFQQLAKNQADFIIGTGEAKYALDALGITVAQIKALGGDTAAVFELVAGKLASFEDGANKTAIAMKIFGKSGSELIPLINGLEQTRKEAEMLGAMIDKDTAAAAERFNDNLTRVGITVQALGLNIAKATLPTLEKMSERLISAAKDAKAMGDAGRMADAGLKLIASAGTVIATIFKTVGDRIGAFFAAIVTAAGGDFKGAFAIISASVSNTAADVNAAIKSLDETWNGGASARRAFQADIRAIENALKKGVAPALRDTAKEAAELAKRLKAAADAQREAIMAVHNDAMAATEADQEIEKQRLERIKEATDAQVESAEIASQLAEDMVSTWDQAGNRIEMTREQYDELARSIDKNAELAKELGLTFSSAFEDAIVKGGQFSDILKGIEQDIVRLITRELVTKPFAGAVTDIIKGALHGGAGGIFESIGSFFAGGQKPMDFGMQFAEGTDFVPRTGLAKLHKGEAVIPAEENARGGRQTIIFNISTPDAGSFRAARGQIEGDMVHAMRRAQRQS